MPFFSIVIPLFNKEKFIRDTLKSVLNQTFSDFEIIIVDDGSTDAGAEKVKQFSDFRIKYHHQENKGVSVARNKGIELAAAEYVCFLDADDNWKENHLLKLFEAIKLFPKAKMYCSRYETKVENGALLKTQLIDLPENFEGYVSDFFKSSYKNRVALTSAVCIKKEIYNEIGGFDAEINSGQDLDYWIKIALKYPVAITNTATVVYNYVADSLSKTAIDRKNLPDFKKYEADEEQNISLKKFLDLYRTEYALNHQILGNKNTAKQYLSEVDAKNMSFKTKLLFLLPPILLRYLIEVKRSLKNKGIDFTVYH